MFPAEPSDAKEDVDPTVERHVDDVLESFADQCIDARGECPYVGVPVVSAAIFRFLAVQPPQRTAVFRSGSRQVWLGSCAGAEFEPLWVNVDGARDGANIFASRD